MENIEKTVTGMNTIIMALNKKMDKDNKAWRG
jgi:hypothetical protein